MTQAEGLSIPELARLTSFRQALHRRPELSGEETGTARLVIAELEKLKPNQIISGLGPWNEPCGKKVGGTGVAAVFGSGAPGPTVLFRCELDGLPIQEQATHDHPSQIDGKGHLCGHDGHMAIMLGLAGRLAKQRSRKGRVVLLFQPAEETGKGAKAVLRDPAFSQLVPDQAYALHNLPGAPFGTILLKEGAMCCASRGVSISLKGKTSHASMPQDGISPVEALMEIASRLKALSNGLEPSQELDEAYKLVTITHLSMGERCFGVSPGSGELWVTLRTVTDEMMNALIDAVHEVAQSAADNNGLNLTLQEDDIFEACTNATITTEAVAKAASSAGIVLQDQIEPMRFSEDFGQFGHHCAATLLLLGSGETQPQLHNPDFDFPDSLIPFGVRIFEQIVRQELS